MDSMNVHAHIQSINGYTLVQWPIYSYLEVVIFHALDRESKGEARKGCTSTRGTIDTKVTKTLSVVGVFVRSQASPEGALTSILVRPSTYVTSRSSISR